MGLGHFARAVLPLPGAAASAGNGDLSRHPERRDFLLRSRLLRLQGQQAGNRHRYRDEEGRQIGQGHHPDARFSEAHRRSPARALEEAEGRRLQGRRNAGQNAGANASSIRRRAAEGRQAADRDLPSGFQRRSYDFGIVQQLADQPVPALRIEGYVIVSADGRLADADNVMPDELKFEGDKRFFTAALDRADLIVHGRNSQEDQPNAPKRNRMILTRKVGATAPDPDNPKAILWNPSGASFEAACAEAGVRSGTVAIIGGPRVFDMFMDRYDTFLLSQAPRVHLPDGQGCFP